MRNLYLHEIRAAIASGSGIIAFVTMLAAFIISLGMMYGEYERRIENHNASLSIPTNELFFDQVWFYEDESGDRNNSNNATMPLGKVKKPQPLMFIARGLDTEMRQAVDFFSAFPIVDVSVQPDQERNLLTLLFPAPDLLFMIRTVVMLLAMMAGYALICGEREAGTLKLVLTTGVSRAAVFAGKFLGALTVVSIAFLLAFLVYVIILSSMTPLFADGEALIRLISIAAVGMLAIAVFFSLAVLISASTRNSSHSLVITLFLWLILVFTVPGMTSLAAQMMAPVDSDEKVARLKFEKATALERAYAEQHPDEDTTSSGSYGRRYDAVQPQIREELRKLEEEHARKRRLQMTLTTDLARLSPIGSLTFAVTGLSRNGLADYRIYRDDLQEIKTAIGAEVNSIFSNQRIGEMFGRSNFDLHPELKNIVYTLLGLQAEHAFRAVDFATVWSLIWVDIGLLATIAIVLAGFAFFLFSRYDVR